MNVLLWLQVNANPETSDIYGPEPPEPPPLNEDGEGQQQQDDGKVKGHWQKRLTDFQKLMFIKAFQEEKVSISISQK